MEMISSNEFECYTTAVLTMFFICFLLSLVRQNRCIWSCSFLIAGPQFWPLPCVELEYEACINQLKWFAQFLLDGAVFSRLKPFVKHLLSPPSLMTKQWAQ